MGAQKQLNQEPVMANPHKKEENTDAFFIQAKNKVIDGGTAKLPGAAKKVIDRTVKELSKDEKKSEEIGKAMEKIYAKFGMKGLRACAKTAFDLNTLNGTSNEPNNLALIFLNNAAAADYGAGDVKEKGRELKHALKVFKSRYAWKFIEKTIKDSKFDPPGAKEVDRARDGLFDKFIAAAVRPHRDAGEVNCITPGDAYYKIEHGPEYLTKKDMKVIYKISKKMLHRVARRADDAATYIKDYSAACKNLASALEFKGHGPFFDLENFRLTIRHFKPEVASDITGIMAASVNSMKNVKDAAEITKLNGMELNLKNFEKDLSDMSGELYMVLRQKALRMNPGIRAKYLELYVFEGKAAAGRYYNNRVTPAPQNP